MATIGGYNVVTNGLVLSLDAGNRKSYPGTGTTWFDLSGNGNDFEMVNSPTFQSNFFGGCFSFDGVNTYFTRDSNSSLTFLRPTLIITCTKQTGGGTQSLIAKGGYGAYWNYGMNRPTSQTFFARNNNGETTSPTFSVSYSTFDIYAAVWDGSTIQFYRNGEYGGSNNLNYSPIANNSLFIRIGCAWSQNSLTNTEFFNGKISTVQIYNRALLPEEILQNYNATKARFGL